MEALRRDLAAAEARAAVAEARLSAVLEAIPEGVVLLDAAGRYVLWNQAYADIYHRSADLFAPGRRLVEVLRVGVERGDYPDAVGREAEWLAERERQLLETLTEHIGNPVGHAVTLATPPHDAAARVHSPRETRTISSRGTTLTRARSWGAPRPISCSSRRCQPSRSVQRTPRSSSRAVTASSEGASGCHHEPWSLMR